MAEDRTVHLTLTLPESEARRLIAYMLWKEHKSSDESLRGLINGGYSYMMSEGIKINAAGVDAVVRECWPPEPKPRSKDKPEINY